MNFTMASLSCVGGKDHSLPHLLELMPHERGGKIPCTEHLLSMIPRLARRFREFFRA